MSVNAEDFIVDKSRVFPKKVEFLSFDPENRSDDKYILRSSLKEEIASIAQIQETNGTVRRFLKRTAGHHFFNPFDFEVGTKQDLRYNKRGQVAKWVEVSKSVFDKYLAFLETQRKLFLSQAEREYIMGDI